MWSRGARRSRDVRDPARDGGRRRRLGDPEPARGQECLERDHDRGARAGFKRSGGRSRGAGHRAGGSGGQGLLRRRRSQRHGRARHDAAGARVLRGLARILEAMARMTTPLVAKVHGFALAGGCGLAAGCDIVIASDDAVFGLPEIKVGLLPLIVMAPILRSVGRKRGMLMILSGEQVSAREAFDMGLVSRVVPRVELDAAVDALARTLAGYSPTALGLAKEAATTATGLEYSAALRYLREMLTLVAMSDDAKEGIAAFFEKRPPR